MVPWSMYINILQPIHCERPIIQKGIARDVKSMPSIDSCVAVARNTIDCVSSIKLFCELIICLIGQFTINRDQLM